MFSLWSRYMKELIPTTSPETVDATETCGSTLVGAYPNEKTGIYDRGGNCFSVKTKDGEVRIVNFYYENLQILLNSTVIEFPIKVHLLCEGVGVIHDERIPDQFYKDRFCEVCCPEGYLPYPQRLELWREDLSGHRTRYKSGGYVFTKFSTKLRGKVVDGKWVVDEPQTIIYANTKGVKYEEKMDAGYIYCPFIPEIDFTNVKFDKYPKDGIIKDYYDTRTINCPEKSDDQPS